ncbi:MAG: Ig-like domain-containing protein [Myxococcota bacterium]
MTRHPLLVALALVAIACGSDPEPMGIGPIDPMEDPTDPTDPSDPSDPTDPTDPSDPTDPTDPTDPEVPDATAPSVVSTTPEDGALGQLAEVSIDLEFSEPMDVDSVREALDTTALGLVDVTWNTDQTVFTITPLVPLAYADGLGQDPATVDPLLYVVTLADTAHDLAGNPLDVGVRVELGTLRLLDAVLSDIPALTASITPSEVVEVDGGHLEIGDDASDGGVRAAFTFDLAPLPADTAEITSARLRAAQLINWTIGTPYDDLGDAVHLDHVSFTTLQTELGINAAFNATQVSLASHEGFVEPGVTFIDFDVTADVQDDLSERAFRGDRAQFLAYFDDPTDLEHDDDLIVLNRPNLALEVVYLAP